MKQETVSWIERAEEVYADLCDAWQDDMENGVKWLNEKAVDDFKRKYPELNKSLSRTMQFLREIADSDDTSPIPEGYVILCKKCGEDLGYIFDEHPKVTSHEELTTITKEWVYVQRT